MLKFLNTILYYRGVWHASCVKKVYAVHRKVLAVLSSPYTHPASPYSTSQQPHDTSVPSDPSFTDADVEESFCRALRSSGVPMVVVMEPNQGGLVNISGHTATTPDLSAFTSNPLFWGMKYLQPDWYQILRGDLNRIKRVRKLMLLFLSGSLQCTRFDQH